MGKKQYTFEVQDSYLIVDDIVESLLKNKVVMDIDKAYIMGQSYDDNAHYIKWSPLFNYNSVETLQASKTLPIPKGIKIEKGDYDISNLINDLDAQNISEVLDDVANKASAKFIRQLANIIRVVELHPGVKYDGSEVILDKLIKVLNGHEFYQSPNNVAEAAFKNIASSNIYQVSHDIRNRDQAYTAIAMNIMRSAADKSPKGDQVSKLNMLNPITKYIMQYQNLVGKDVISVAANGEKVWFNLFYYWTKTLKSKDTNKINKLKFSHTYSRIAGRAAKTPYEKTSTYIPDLNKYDPALRQAMLSEFGVNMDDDKYVYVDQLISQLLSAATDPHRQ